MAEDLTSEAFLRGIQKIHTYDGRVKASIWLCAIGRNLWLNEIKREKRRSALESAIGLPRSRDPALIAMEREQLKAVQTLAKS